MTFLVEGVLAALLTLGVELEKQRQHGHQHVHRCVQQRQSEVAPPRHLREVAQEQRLHRQWQRQPHVERQQRGHLRLVRERPRQRPVLRQLHQYAQR